MSLNFSDRVVLITGAKQGLGLKYAWEFAKLGCKRLVLNDLGTSRSGNIEKTSSSLEDVALEIQKQYPDCEILCDGHSVVEGESIVEAAVKRFGTIHVLINNAGFLRDRSILKMTQEDFDAIYQVHLLAPFILSRACWPHMKSQQFGRIIFASSASGLYGNFGQSNYSAMKSGLIGLTKSLALEGSRCGIQCNCICPLAATRMSKNVIPHVETLFDPKYIAPVVSWLCHDDCKENGSVIECGGGFVSKIRLQRSRGIVVRGEEQPVESLRSNWKQATDFENEPTHPNSGMESFQDMAEKLRPHL